MVKWGIRGPRRSVLCQLAQRSLKGGTPSMVTKKVSRKEPLSPATRKAVLEKDAASRVNVSKTQRQFALGQLIARNAISSQPELVDWLARDGIEATQATVSRDLLEMGAVKVRVPGGDLVYAIPEMPAEQQAPVDHLRRIFGEWVVKVTYSANIVVLRTPPGCAHVVASAIDRSNSNGVLGTVAGDDTVFVIADESTTGKILASTFRDLANLTK